MSDSLRVLWYCPLCERGDFKSRTGVILHVQRKHPGDTLPPWWEGETGRKGAMRATRHTAALAEIANAQSWMQAGPLIDIAKFALYGKF